MILKPKTTLIILLLAGSVFSLVVGISSYFGTEQNQPSPKPVNRVRDFEECMAAGYPIQESYPRTCTTPQGVTFVEDIGNELEKTDLIRVTNPRPNQFISSPLKVEGEARGFWFFEASFPIRLFDGEGRELAVTVAQAKGEWMTKDFVEFHAILEFPKPASSKGILVFQKDNPSGLPEHDDELFFPIKFE